MNNNIFTKIDEITPDTDSLSDDFNLTPPSNPQKKVTKKKQQTLGKTSSFQGKNKYKLEQKKDKKTFIKQLESAASHQLTASAYHPIDALSIGNDKLLYRRSQNKHLFTDLNNEQSQMVNKIPASTLLKPEKTKHNFGLYGTFGTQMNTKISNGVVDTRPDTEQEKSAAKKNLDDAILNHKNEAVKHIVKSFKKTTLKTIIIDENQLAAEYPCVILRLNNTYKYHAKMIENDVHHEYDWAYPEFLTHLLIACINKALYDKKIGVYFERRQSFGFLTPSASDVGSAIRLSIGLVPNIAWKEGVIAGIKTFDGLVDTLWTNKRIIQGKQGKMGSPHSKFRSGDINIYAYKLFFQKLLNKDSEKSITTLIADLGTKYAQINKLVNTKNYFKSFCAKILGSLSKASNPEFDQLYQTITDLYNNLLKNKKDNKNMTLLSINERMQILNEKMNQYKELSIKKVSDLEEIGLTSDSPPDEDVSLPNVKHYTPTGMSALSAPLFAYQALCSQKSVFYKVEDYAYFELANWDNKLSSKKIQKTHSYAETDIIYVDNNPCVNAAKAPVKTTSIIEQWFDNNMLNNKPKMLVVDTTSSTQEQLKRIKEAWKKSSIAILCFAASGLKNQQVGLDMAQYGEDRIYINENYLSNCSSKNANILLAFPEKLREITKASSSVYATTVRRAIRENIGTANGISPH